MLEVFHLLQGRELLYKISNSVYLGRNTDVVSQSAAMSVSLECD